MVKEAEVQDTDSNWYAVRMSPYRTTENMIDGVVITFVDITKIKRAEMALRESGMRTASGRGGQGLQRCCDSP